MTPHGVEHISGTGAAAGKEGPLISMTPHGVEHLWSVSPRPEQDCPLISMTPHGVEHGPLNRPVQVASAVDFHDASRR